MVTEKIKIKAHLAEYVNSKYFDQEENCVHFPDKLDLYHVIWDLLTKRPINAVTSKDSNVIIALPNRRQGKDPMYYNYLGERSIAVIEKKIETMFFAELRQLLDDNKHEHGTAFLDTVHTFICKYRIESITPDALLKDHYRWRELVRQKKQRRKYVKSK